MVKVVGLVVVVSCCDPKLLLHSCLPLCHSKVVFSVGGDMRLVNKDTLEVYGRIRTGFVQS